MHQLESFFFDFIMQLVPVMLRMQLRGLLVDQAQRSGLRETYDAERQEAITRLEAFSPNRKIMGPKTISSTALIKLLYDDLGLPKQHHPKTKRLTANAEALQKLELKVSDAQRPHFLDILAVRDLGVLISTFLDAPLDLDGRFRWSTNLAGAVTGRTSTSESPFWSGGNVQQIPDEVRIVFVADPGCCFIYADGEQAEARVVAYLAQDKGLMALFDSGRNVHMQMAERLFGIAEASVDKGSEYYRLAKATVHASNYGLGKRKAALLMKRTEREAEAILARYHNSFPNVRSVFQDGVKRQIDSSRTLTTPFGRRRQFFGRWGDDLYRAAFSHTPQSTVADWLDIGILRLVRFAAGNFDPPSADSTISRYLKLDASKLRFVHSLADMQLPIEPAANVHDGLLAQVRISDLPRAINVVREALTYEIPFEHGQLTIPVDIKVGERWGTVLKATPEHIAELMEEAA